MIKKIFEKIEHKIRGVLSHYPTVYAIIGGVGVVLFWRGVWHTMDYLMLNVKSISLSSSSIDLANELWWDGPLSLLIGLAMLLLTGVFVSNFIGNEILISGLRGEKKLSEKTEEEIETEADKIDDIEKELKNISKKLKQ
ncbi:MAG: hypothetical protein NTY12_03550 [Candidatus Falkowbacteria bacterium]|nr:hypothetical protein [Candidatus Falkowbacteria bacterium]